MDTRDDDVQEWLQALRSRMICDRATYHTHAGELTMRGHAEDASRRRFAARVAHDVAMLLADALKGEGEYAKHGRASVVHQVLETMNEDAQDSKRT